MPDVDPASRDPFEIRFTRLFAVFVGVAAAFPFLFGLLIAPAGSTYLGYQYNFDDHMVYAAWMRQAMDGHFFFDNRFAIEPQPTLTVNVYFFLLGLVAKIVTIPMATMLARIGFSALFVVLVAKLIRKATPDVYSFKLALSLSVFGGGIGYLVWRNFGVALAPNSPLSSLLEGRLPTDVWQPEGYVFPSMLTNSLFIMSLCLIAFILLAILGAKDSWKPVPGGFLAFAALMNSHSYDVLLLALVLVGFLAAQIAAKQITWAWVGRALVIASGAVLPALWFVYVLRHDPVFQARAATPTYSANFRQVLFGYLPMMGLALAAFIGPRKRHRGAALGVAGLLIGLAVAAGGHDPGAYWMGITAWAGLLAGSVALVALSARENPTWNLLASWAVIGTVAPYFPALFQRKLSMGLAVPWAILAALGVAALVGNREKNSRNLATILGIIVVCGSSLLWTVRETRLAKEDVSNTLVHSVYLKADARKILEILQSTPGRKIVIAVPGIKGVATDESGHELPDQIVRPYLPDLNPVVAGLAGAYAYAGHWSETPDYGERHDESLRFFLGSTSDAYRRALLEKVKPDYLIAPNPASFPEAHFEDVRKYGTPVYEGTQFILIRVSHP